MNPHQLGERLLGRSEAFSQLSYSASEIAEGQHDKTIRPLQPSNHERKPFVAARILRRAGKVPTFEIYALNA